MGKLINRIPGSCLLISRLPGSALRTHVELRRNRLFEERLTMSKVINRIPGSCLLISSLPGLALRTHVESLGKPRDVNKRSQSLAR